MKFTIHWRKFKITEIQPRFVLKLKIHFIKVIEDFLEFQLGNQFGEKNQNTPYTTQICCETYNSLQVGNDMNLNCRFLHFQLGN